MKVDYKDEYPTFDYIKLDDETKRLTFLTKYNDWKYEEEYRLVSLKPKKANYPPVKNKTFIFPPEMLKAVIFGCRMSDDHKNLIKGWCKKRENKVELRQAKLSDTVYELEIETLSSI